MFGRTGSHTDEDLSLPTRHTAAPGHRRDDYCGPMKVVVCAFGTRGDVQPLVAIAAGLAEKDWCNEVTFVTHKQHCEGFVRTLLRQEANSKCKVLPVDSPPVIWKGVGGSSLGCDDRTMIECAHRAQQDACVVACKGAGLILFSMFALEGFHIAEKMQVPCAVCQPYLISTPMPSSFKGRMRRAYPRLFRRLIRSIAKKSSHLSPLSPRNSATDSTACTESVQAGNTRSEHSNRLNIEQSNRSEEYAVIDYHGESAWNHVEHWMWPLFTDRWGTLRARLGLPPYPLGDGKRETLLAAAVHAGMLDNREKNAHEIEGVEYVRSYSNPGIDPARLPPVLYLFSKLVVDASPFWPDSVRVCGFVYPSPSLRQGNPDDAIATVEGVSTAGQEFAAQQHVGNKSYRTEAPNARRGRAANIGTAEPLPPEVDAFLCARDDKPLFIGFGSMWNMCPMGYGLACALRTMLLAAKQTGVRCLVALPGIMSGRDEGKDVNDRYPDVGTRELEAATDFVLGEFSTLVARDDLLVHEGPLAHECLFPRCSLVIHHGGSGTTAAVLRAGIPHVICPQHLDQFFWAERIQHLNVGSVLERSLFNGRESPRDEPPAALVSRARAAISTALRPQVRLRAACLGVKIRSENGLVDTLRCIEYIMDSHEASSGAPISTMRPQPTTKQLSPDKTSMVNQMSLSSYAQEMPDVGKRSKVKSRSRDNLSLVDGNPEPPHMRYKRGGEVRSGNGDVPEGNCGNTDEQLMLREMPNGMDVWFGRGGEEEIFFIYNEIYEEKTYGRMGLQVRDGDTVWDIGANVGLASIFFELSTDTPDSLNIYAFEPAPINRKALQRNLGEHCPRAGVFGCALGAKNVDGVSMTFYPRMPGNSTFKPREKERLQGGRMGNTQEAAASTSTEYKERRDRSVRTGTMGPFFQGEEQVSCDIRTISWAMSNLGVERIDLLKVDVEGAELDVLMGVEEEDWPRIMQVVAEVHPDGERVRQIRDLLRKQGFRVFEQALGLDGTPLACKQDFSTTGDDVSTQTTTSRSSSRCGGSSSILSDITGGAVGDSGFVDHDDRNIHCRSDDSREKVGASRRRDANSRVEEGVVFMVYATRV